MPDLQGYAQNWSGRNYDARRSFERVISELELADRRSPLPNLGARFFLALAYAGVGDEKQCRSSRRGKAWPIMRTTPSQTTRRDLSRDGSCATWGRRCRDAALPHLLEMPGGIRPGDLRFSPYWDPLRKDPRFETLLKNPPPVRY